MRILSTPHLSRSAARNVGWKAASGEIFFFADSDEIYKEEYVSLAVNQIRSDDKPSETDLPQNALLLSRLSIPFARGAQILLRAEPAFQQEPQLHLANGLTLLGKLVKRFKHLGIVWPTRESHDESLRSAAADDLQEDFVAGRT